MVVMLQTHSETKQNLRCFYFYIISAITIFFLIYAPAYHIPMHSDDFIFTLRGISLKALLNHYLNWEGRLIGDYTASLLLCLFTKPVYMAINSLVFLIVVINISLIPSLLQGKSLINNYSSFFLWIAFLLYWLCNPNLGQTSFWLVGSAIYLWPLMWLGLYLLCLFTLLKDCFLKTYHGRCTKVFLLCILGFFAGLSNEATGATTVFLTLVLFFIYHKGFVFTLNGFSFNHVSKSTDGRRQIILTGLLSSLAGFLILVLAPGNFIRLASSFPGWQSTPFATKVMFHILWRVPDAVAKFWLAFIIVSVITLFLSYIMDKEYNKLRLPCFVISVILFAISAISVFSFEKMKYNSSVCISLLIVFLIFALLSFFYNLSLLYKAKRFINFSNVSVAFIFFTAALFSIFVFVASPYWPPRALNTFNFFIVLTIIVLMNAVLAKAGKSKYLVYFIFLFIIPCFMFSYARFTYAAVQTDIQAEIRDQIILQAKAGGKDKAQIPDWYFTKLAKNDDKFDLWQSTYIQEYYGIKRIVSKPVHFNYAVLKTKRPLIDNFQIANNHKIRLFYNDSSSFFDVPCLVFELEKPEHINCEEERTKMTFCLHIANETKTISIDDNSTNFAQFGDCCYYTIKLTDMDLCSINKIDVEYGNTIETIRLAPLQVIQ